MLDILNEKLSDFLFFRLEKSCVATQLLSLLRIIIHPIFPIISIILIKYFLQICLAFLTPFYQ